MTALLQRLAAAAVVIAGVVLSAVLVSRAGSPEQCPDEFTQAQVDASDCIVGANIGLGLVWIFVVPLVMAIALWLAALVWRQSSESPDGEGK
ncbi:MAG: hypothetical protein OES13_01990 [Acidimicrobiia bacterium]|nr:hypothetical protein [Acidimicrobiia bacterium]